MRFGPFELLEQLGSGSTAKVWKARETGGAVVAVKVLHAHLGADQDATQGFEQEARVGREVTCARLPRVLGAGSYHGQRYLVMEHIEGIPLSKLLAAQGVLPWPIARGILRDISVALTAIHAAGVVHGDLKPANIMVTPQGRAMLIDFGTSRSPRSSAGGHAGYGSPGYAAPDRQLTPQSDAYAFGCLMFEMLAGRLPFEGPLAAVVKGHALQRPPSHLLPAKHRPVVERLLAKDPARRAAVSAVLASL